jgi:hypothetical protein
MPAAPGIHPVKFNNRITATAMELRSAGRVRPVLRDLYTLYKVMHDGNFMSIRSHLHPHGSVLKPPKGYG